MSEPNLAVSNTSREPALLPVQASWLAARAVPFRMAISVPLAGMKLRDLHELHCGSLLLTSVSSSDDVSVHVGAAMLGWAELDNVDGKMAVRLTRLV